MLRLPKFDVAQPTHIKEVTALLAEHGTDAMIIAGGTDVLPNMKHELFAPKTLISLSGVKELIGIRTEDDALVIGAMTPLDQVAANSLVIKNAPALAQAAGLVAGPQLRSMGTLGGNVMLDTRCQWYNQTYFWRKALGFCLKKDGSLCHVIEGGSKCVAAASNDTAPALMSLDATLRFEQASGARELAIDDLWKSDGIFNKKVTSAELLTEIRLPLRSDNHLGAYGKLRDRGSIDFPLFGIAVRIDVDQDRTVVDAAAVAVALQARPTRIKKIAETLRGTVLGSAEFEAGIQAACALGTKQCRPMPNVPGDADYRHQMVPVYLKRTLLAAANGTGPVHAI
ncbi:MAG: 4-hydroxybenzoyl-CoA reductase subunit beta [Planctomycetota bacterium]|jgi:4-hydroxybenzoyl-CoA reductase subunit beta